MKTIDHECYVSLEVAKLLKEAGFDWPVMHFYDEFEDGTIPFYSRGSEELQQNMNVFGYYSAPTLDVAQRWLREVKNCSIMIDVFVHNLDKNNIYYTHNWIIYLDGERYSGSNWDDTHYYEVAQESGIKKALELILEKGKKK